MNRKIGFSSLVIEVTRRCNMHCAHCLRGDAQAMDFPKEVLNKLLEQTDSIDELTFGGGEISLVPEKLDEILAAVKKSGVPVDSFYAVTNGKNISNRFLMSMLNWYAFVAPRSGDEECIGLALSDDEFHEPIPRENKALLSAFSFFREFDKKTDFSRRAILLNEGRAKALYDYEKRELTPDFQEPEDNGYTLYFDDTVYVSCTGDILCSCDAAYDDQARFKIGNVFDPDWAEKYAEATKNKNMAAVSEILGCAVNA